MTSFLYQSVLRSRPAASGVAAFILFLVSAPPLLFSLFAGNDLVLQMVGLAASMPFALSCTLGVTAYLSAVGRALVFAFPQEEDQLRALRSLMQAEHIRSVDLVGGRRPGGVVVATPRRGRQFDALRAVMKRAYIAGSWTLFAPDEKLSNPSVH